MAIHRLLAIFLIGIISSSSMTAGFNQMMEPLYGRSFSLLNLLPFQRIAAIQSAALASRVTALETSVALLTTQLASTGRCPAGSGSTRMGTYCYSVLGASAAAPPLGFQAALLDCQAKGGSLAEPQATRAASRNFYNALRSKFPQVRTIENSSNGGKFWIGYYTVTGTDLLSVTEQDPVPTATSTFPPAATDLITPPAVANSGALLNKPGLAANPYWLFALNNDPTVTNPYICQFTALA